VNIELTRGLDGLLFGMSEDEVIAVNGPPDKTVVTDNGNRDLCYYTLKLVLKIEPTNEGRLGWISVRNRSSRLSGLDPWSMEQKTLLHHLEIELREAYEFEDYGEMETFFFPQSWVELQYELGELTAINFGVPYHYNDEPRWPPKLA
jgi:hypothetical protein